MIDPEIRNKIELVSGDFFKEMPIKADAYLMRFILHDWYVIIISQQRNLVDDSPFTKLGLTRTV